MGVTSMLAVRKLLVEVPYLRIQLADWIRGQDVGHPRPESLQGLGFSVDQYIAVVLI